MPEPTYEITHDHISPEPDLMTEAELRAYLAERAAEDPDPDRGWARVAETLEVCDRYLYAEVKPESAAELIAEEVRTITVGAAIDGCSREDIEADLEELDGQEPGDRAWISTTNPDWPYLVVVDDQGQPMTAGDAAAEIRRRVGGVTDGA